MSVLSSAVIGDTIRCHGMSWEYSADLLEVRIKMRSILLESPQPTIVVEEQLFRSVRPNGIWLSGV